MTRIAIAVFAAGSVSAQDAVFTLEFDTTSNTGEVRAQFFGDLSVVGATSIISIWADASFRITGDGIAPVNFTSYNPAYDTLLGDAEVTSGVTATFVGNTNSIFGTPDPSNPLWVADFTYDGSPSQLQFEVFGQNSFLFGHPDFPFGYNDLYFGTSNRTYPYSHDVEVIIVPAPATLTVLGLGGVLLRRRR